MSGTNDRYIQEIITEPGPEAEPIESCTLYELLLDLKAKPADQIGRFQPIITMLENELELRFKDADTTVELYCQDKISPSGEATRTTGDQGDGFQIPATVTLFDREFKLWQIGLFGLLAFVILKRL